MATPVRRKCFVTFHHADQSYADTFISKFGDVFIARALGVSDDDDFINSTDTDYVMRRIRELYLADSTVTIMLAGKCTWARRYVDWEIASSLRNDAVNKRSGLLGIRLSYLPSNETTTVNERFHDNVECGYADFHAYPTSDDQLHRWIEAAYERRDTVAPDNRRALHQRNRACD